METVLKTQGLTKSYGGRRAVSQVDLTVKRGDIYGFIGKNGAGKTTLMRMAVGLAKPTAGSILLFGEEMEKQKLRKVGSVIESPALFPNMTARQNVEVYRRLLGIREESEVEEVLQTVGLQDTGSKKVSHFSLGMKQRLAIGLALLGKPEFLILDEPTNGLDPTGIKEIRDLLLYLNQQRELTILVSSHILGELSRIASCYGIINNGVLVDEFSATDLENRCQSYLQIVVDDVQRAAGILSKQLQTRDIQVFPEGILRLYGFDQQGGQINTMLVQQGITVFSLFLGGQNLEGYFMSLMGGENHVSTHTV